MSPRSGTRASGDAAKRLSACRVFARAIRLQQWAKNLLVFVPVALAGRHADPAVWAIAVVAFLAMGFIASAAYLTNDLCDLADDRRHWSKQRRPLAAGELSVARAFIAIPVLLLAGFGLAALLGADVLAVAVAYAVMTLCYSFWLKRIPVLDTLLLACMFTLRLLLGVVAIGAMPSPWLYAFSMALFLSVSLAKRHTEVLRLRKLGRTAAAGRGYQAGDAPLILTLGLGAAAAAIACLARFLLDAVQAGFYLAPAFLWLTPVAVLLWLGRVWHLSQRGELDDDPVAFALGDRTSLALGASVAVAFVLATAVDFPGWSA